MDSPNAQNPTTTVPANIKAPPLEGGHSTNIGGMWNLKHDISLPKFYELLIKTWLKYDTAVDLKSFCNRIKMCLNEIKVSNKTFFQSTSQSEDTLSLNNTSSHQPSYSWNAQTYTSFGY